MTFSKPDHWVWDFWLADDGVDHHLYYLCAPRALGDPDLRHRNARIGHATSRDLITWTDHGIVLEPGAGSDFDASATWTGSVIQDDNGRWRMFYTGSRFARDGDIENVEVIGEAHSHDLRSWVKHGPVLVADRQHYETLADGTWREEAWRDPWVRRTDDGSGWEMLVTARSRDGDDVLDRGVIGYATSPDLGIWTSHPPISSPGAGFMHLEVPQLVDIAGRRVLLFSCDSAHLAGARAGETGGIWAVEAPYGATTHPVEEAQRIADERFYSGRVVTTRDGREMLLAFENVGAAGDFVGRLSDPMPLAWAQGALHVELPTEAPHS